MKYESDEVDEARWRGNEDDRVVTQGVKDLLAAAPFSRNGSAEEDPELEAILALIDSAAANAARPPYDLVYDVDGLIPHDDAPALIFGAPEALKTWVVLHVCHCIATGALFLGSSVMKREKALFINIDAGKKTFSNRMRRISAAASFDFLTISSESITQRILDGIMERYAGGFVAIDCLAAFYHPPLGVEQGEAMRSFASQLRRLYEKHDCGGIVIDHTNRGADGKPSFYGSVQKKGTFRTMIELSAAPREVGKPRRTTMKCEKMSEGEGFTEFTISVDFRPGMIEFATVEGNGSADETMRKAKILHFAQTLGAPFTGKMFDEAKLGNLAEYRATRDAMVSDGTLDKRERTGKGGGFLYSIAQPKLSPAETDNGSLDDSWSVEDAWGR